MFNAFRFNQQSKEVRFGSYVFGPVVMRMYYFLNKPDEALEVSYKLEPIL
jgi:pentatricopeptide repeat domain-containing protein 2